LEATSQLGIIDTVAGDVGVCHDVTLGISDVALEKVAPSDAGLIVVFLLER
jgi:hypothetical protein